MSRKFESADPLRRGTRRPPPAALQAAAMRRTLANPPAEAAMASPAAADLTQKQPPAALEGAGFQEFALKMCTREDVADARYHVLKFQAPRAKVDPAKDFVPPIRLHRKDPRQLQFFAGQEGGGGGGGGGGGDGSAMDVDAGGAGAGAGANNGNGSSSGGPGAGAGAGSAGAGGGGSGSGSGKSGEEQPQKRRPFGRKRKTRQIYGGEKHEAARRLRYEEYYPWVMEDFDGKNTWVSSFEAAQSENHAVLTYDAASNGFKVIPVEKFYKMTAAARYATLSLEDAEERMESTQTRRDRWLMARLNPRLESPAGSVAGAAGGAGAGGYGSVGGHLASMFAPDAHAGPSSRLRTVVGSEDRKHKYNMDEEMDYDDQELFDDDEGAPLLDGPEEELKEAEERIKREQRKANELMEAGRNEDIDDLFGDDDETREGKQGRRLRKALRSLEKNQYYETDDEANPYASEDDASDSDAELDAQTSLAAAAAAATAAAAGNQPGSQPGIAIKREEDVDAAAHLLPISRFRKKHINRDALPRGTIVLQLPPEILKKFQAGVWNPDAKRAESAPPETDPRVLTREDVRRNIKSGETEIRQLFNALRPKLAQHPDNVALLRQYVKEIARRRDKKLYLRN